MTDWQSFSGYSAINPRWFALVLTTKTLLGVMSLLQYFLIDEFFLIKRRPYSLTLADQQLISLAMYIDNFHIGIFTKVLAKFTQKNVHATSVEVIIIVPNFKQRLFPG